MWEIIVMLFWSIVVGLLVVVALLVFSFALLFFRALYKVYGPKKIDPKTCLHLCASYTDSHPDKPWTCNDCGLLH